MTARRLAQPRIGIGGVWHETNTFAPAQTLLDDFLAYRHAAGPSAVADAHRGTRTEIAGAVDACRRAGADPRAFFSAGAIPSGTVAADARRTLWDEFLAQLDDALPLDGLVLALHGAMVAEDAEDADSDLLAAVRRHAGDLPVAVTLDLHANPGSGLLDSADLVVAYETYPHVDAYERGEQAASLLLDLVDGRLRPSLAWRRLPLLTVPLAQATDEQPMRGLRARARRWEERGVESAAILPGFPYADVPRAGFTVVANAREPELAEACADDLAGAVWETRAAFHRELVGPEGAVARACAAPSGPVVLADVGDNVGGGAPGDGTVLLEALLDAGADGAVVVLWDPQAAAAAAAAGRGARVELEVGGKAGALQGRPVHVSGSVLRAGNAAYRRTGSYMTGQQVDMGLCAVVATGGIAIVLTTERVMPFDVDHLLAVGVEPGSRKIIVVKSALAWRAAFGAVAAEVVAVDTPGVCAARLETLAYARVPRPIAPLDAM